MCDNSKAPRIALVLTPLDEKNLRLACQIGVTDVVYYNMETMPETGKELQEVKSLISSFGLQLSVVEGGPKMDQIITAGPGRDEQIESFKRCLINMGAIGIRVLCYNFMPPSLKVARTSYNVSIRGGSLSSEFDRQKWDDTIKPGDLEISEAQMWENLEFFLKSVIPTAEKAGVFLAVHPDDPPLSKLRGTSRILSTPGAFERLISLYDSPHNGITFCQGTFSSMGINVPMWIERLGHRVHFVHFRDVRGVASEKFVEVWQDQGQTDMLEALKCWKKVGFVGPIRPDHVPLLPDFEAGHETGLKAPGYFSGIASGYTMLGRIFAVGYMRGLFEAVWGKSN